jgi:hypothetical protein
MSKTRRKIVPTGGDDQVSAQEKVIEQLQAAKQVPSKNIESSKESDSGKKTVRITVDIPKELHSRIKTHTKSRGQSIKGYLLFLASQDMKQYDAV